MGPPRASAATPPPSSSATAPAAAARLQLWQCPICLATLSEPMLTTCCGQSFCRVCLDAALQRVDACPMCRAPLLSGPHAMTRNRALDELLQRISTSASDDTTAADGERDILLTIRENQDDEIKPSRLHRLSRWVRDHASRLCTNASLSSSAVRLQQWRHWLRIHWTTLQCVFYVFLFGVFVFFLRVQEEEFAERDTTTRHNRLRHTGG